MKTFFYTDGGGDLCPKNDLEHFERDGFGEIGDVVVDVEGDFGQFVFAYASEDFKEGGFEVVEEIEDDFKVAFGDDEVETVEETGNGRKFD